MKDALIAVFGLWALVATAWFAKWRMGSLEAKAKAERAKAKSEFQAGAVSKEIKEIQEITEDPKAENTLADLLNQ